MLKPRPRLLGAAWGSRIAAEVGLAATFTGFDFGAAFGAALLLAIAEGVGGDSGVATVVGDRQ